MLDHQALVQEMKSLKRFALKLTQNSSDAEDLLQLTLLKSLEHGDSFEQGTNLFGWTSRILYNTFVSQYRRRVRYETQYDAQEYIDQQWEEGCQETEVELDQVLAAMGFLSEDHQRVLELVCIEGLPYATVAEVLAVPVGTVRSRLNRARQALQDVLQVQQSVQDSTMGDACLVA